MYTSRLALMRKYLSPLQPTGIYRHGLAGGDVRHALERETARIIMRWLESSGPPVPRAVADCLLRSPKCGPPTLTYSPPLHRPQY